MWHIEDSRTHARATIAAFPSEVSALLQIARWRARDAKGKRPDMHDVMPHLVAVEDTATVILRALTVLPPGFESAGHE